MDAAHDVSMTPAECQIIPECRPDGRRLPGIMNLILQGWAIAGPVNSVAVEQCSSGVPKPESCMCYPIRKGATAAGLHLAIFPACLPSMPLLIYVIVAANHLGTVMTANTARVAIYCITHHTLVLHTPKASRQPPDFFFEISTYLPAYLPTYP